MFFYAPRAFGEVLINDSQIAQIYFELGEKRSVGGVIKTIPPSLHFVGAPRNNAIVTKAFLHNALKIKGEESSFHVWIEYKDKDEVVQVFKSIVEQMQGSNNIVIIS